MTRSMQCPSVMIIYQNCYCGSAIIAMPSWDGINGGPLQWRLAEGGMSLLVYIITKNEQRSLYTLCQRLTTPDSYIATPSHYLNRLTCAWCMVIMLYAAYNWKSSKPAPYSTCIVQWMHLDYDLAMQGQVAMAGSWMMAWDSCMLCYINNKRPWLILILS